MARTAVLFLACWAAPALADALERIDASASSKTPEVELREALALARRECEDRSRPRGEACFLARELEPMLAEFERGGASVRQVLGARRCLSALRWKGPEPAAAVRVMQWCAPVFDGCRPGLMGMVGTAAKLDRTFIVGSSCAEQVCPSRAVPASVCVKSGDFYEVKTTRDVTALLKEVWSRELPPPLALELQAAFTKPRSPFFADAPVPLKVEATRLEAAVKALGPKLAGRGTQGNFDALVQKLGAPHVVRDQSVSWYAAKAKSCVELRYAFEPVHKLELRSLPPAECREPSTTSR